MPEERVSRHLAAILAADVVGYSRLMEQDESDTFERLRAHRKQLFQPAITRYRGRIFKLMGDGLLAEFGSVVDAVECAIVLQRAMAKRNNGVEPERRIDVRIGVNLGDVIVEGDDCHGDGVNIAARLQTLAEPGGIAVSRIVAESVAKRLNVRFEDSGEQKLKNIDQPVRVYRVALGADGPLIRRDKSRSVPQPGDRRRVKRIFASVLAGLLVPTALVAAWLLGRSEPQPKPEPRPAEPVRVFVASSSNKGEWLDKAIDSFNAASPKNAAFQLDGRPVLVEAVLETLDSGEKEHYRSGTMVKDILDGKIKPVVATPADDFWIQKLNKEWEAINSKPIFTKNALGVARTPLVIAMWESRARALGCWPSPEPQCSWESLRALASNPDGWKMFGRPDWGQFDIGYGYVGESNSGTLTSAILCMRGLGKNGGLVLEEVTASNGCGQMIAAMERAKVHSGIRSAWLLERMRKGGPEYLDAIVTNEQEVVEFNHNKADLREPVVSAYPQDGTMVITHPFAILDGAPWVSAEQVKAAEIFRKYLLSDQQQSLLVGGGLRPINPQAPLAAPLVPEFGVNPTAKFPVLEVPEVLVFDRIREIWHQVKKHAHIAIAFDKSGSMSGDKITHALRGAQEFVSAMDGTDWLAWLAFDDRVYVMSQGLKATTGEQLLADIKSTTAGTGTALYDAVERAFNLVDEARKKQGSALRYGIVILSDGHDTSSVHTSLALLEAKLKPSEHDATGIQIHTIGIGEDANEAVLKKIANLAHGKYWKVEKPADVVAVYKEIATYY